MSGVLPPTVARAASTTVADTFRRAVRIFADRTAVAHPGRDLTYRQLGERADQMAHALRNSGVDRGGRIAVLSENRPEYVETYMAAASLGVTVVALNTRMHPDELAHCVTGAEPSSAA